MATYIQGSDVFIYLNGSTLAISTEILYETAYITFSGLPAIGDVVFIYLLTADDELSISVTATSTSLTDLFFLISEAVSGTPFSADTSSPPLITIIAPDNITADNVNVDIFFSVIACTKSDVLNTENEMLEITQIEQYQTEFLPTFQGKTMSIEQAAVMNVASGEVSTLQLRQWMNDQALLNFIFEMPDSTESGQCYIKSGSISGGVNTGALANFELLVTGPTILT